MRIAALDPGADGVLAERLLALQQDAYRVEARLIGDDRIPPLSEDVVALRSAPLRWLGAFDDDDRLVGAVAWSEDERVVDIDRLVVDPAVHRRGTGRDLVRSVLARAGERRTTVSTGRANVPARTLYERLGFAADGDVEVLPGLWVTRFAHAP